MATTQDNLLMEERVGVFTKVVFTPNAVVFRRTATYTRSKIAGLLIIPTGVLWFSPWNAAGWLAVSLCVVASVGVLAIGIRMARQKGSGSILAVALQGARCEELKAERVIRAADVLNVNLRENTGRSSDDFPYCQIRLNMRPEAGGGSVLVHQQPISSKAAAIVLGLQLADCLQTPFVNEVAS